MRYNEYSYLYPPRPITKSAIPAGILPFYEKQQWMAQCKKNGTCNIIYITPKKQIICKNRHFNLAGGDHRLWKPDNITLRPFLNLPGNGWYVFVAELLHSKVSGLRHINYIHDILVADGEYLVESTFVDRIDILYDLFDTKDGKAGYRIIDDNTWLAQSYTSGFQRLFLDQTDAEDEGLVLKNPNAKLEFCSSPTANSGWQAKCRRATRNASF